MKYTSTRDASVSVSASHAIAEGIAPDGGLYLPLSIPRVGRGELLSMQRMSYAERAARIMSLYLDEFTEDELLSFARQAYDGFDEHPAPVVNRGGELYLELWHGPTCAFKDMALQMLPHLMTASLRKTEQTHKALILVATSGDTGKAALEGFRDVPGTKIMVFYPENGVSQVQKRQMTTQLGDNVAVQAVRGNFDDTQTGVKRIFGDAVLRAEVESKGYRFSSANSINWGRLLPQIVYYFSAYLDCAAQGEIAFGDEVSFSVPTGNFGNILAAYYAREMGLPIGRLICASNSNNVLTEFINTGVYDARRTFVTTLSPSMDILISSNLERLLSIISGDAVKVKAFMDALRNDGVYTVDTELQRNIQELMWADFSRDDETTETIREVWEASGYLLDPHTAVAEAVKQKYLTAINDTRKIITVSAASPFKFCSAVLGALGHPANADGGAELIDILAEETGLVPPEPLAKLATARERFGGAVERDEMEKAVKEFM